MDDEKKTSGEDIPEEKDASISVDDTPLDSGEEIGKIDFIPLDSLLYENDEAVFDSYDQDDSFDSFLSEYRALIAESLIAAKKMKPESENTASNDFPDNKSINASDAPLVEADASKQKKKAKALPSYSVEEREDENITLKPEEYEIPEENEEIFCEPPAVEEEIDLLRGIEVSEDDEEEPEEAQISFFPENKSKNDDEADYEIVKEYDPENPRKIDVVFDFLELFIYTLVAVMILTTFVFKHSVVEGDSMNETLSDGDHLIIWDAFYTPDRDDIIVFEDYSTSLKKAVVKRVIGLPGETVEIKKNSNGEFLVYIEGELIDQDYAYHGPRYSSPNTGVWTLGENEIFVMGDNRYNSTDSRDYSVGPINIDSVLGKVVLRFYPFDQFETFK